MEAAANSSPLGALRIDITPHKREPGTARPFTGSFEAPPGLGLPSVEVLVDRFHAQLNLDFVGNQLIVTGTIIADWNGPCRRCLEPVSDSQVIAIKEIFELDPVDGETYQREEDYADLRPMVFEAILLALPLAPLCGTDCFGPDPERYRTTTVSESTAGEPADGSDGETAPPKDPRWAGLDDLTFG